MTRRAPASRTQVASVAARVRLRAPRVEVGSQVVVAEHRRERVDKGGLAGVLRPVREEELFFRHVAGERVANHALQIGGELVIAPGRVVQEGRPEVMRRPGIERDRRYLGDQVRAGAGTKAARAKVDGAIRAVEQHRIAIEVTRKTGFRPTLREMNQRLDPRRLLAFPRVALANTLRRSSSSQRSTSPWID